MNDSWIRIDRDTNKTGYIKRYAIILNMLLEYFWIMKEICINIHYQNTFYYNGDLIKTFSILYLKRDISYLNKFPIR